MSLLSKKSWNPRNFKNRQRVEKDELDYLEQENARKKRIHKSETEFSHEKLIKVKALPISHQKKPKYSDGDASNGKLETFELFPPKAHSIEEINQSIGKFVPTTFGELSQGHIPWYMQKDSDSNDKPKDRVKMMKQAASVRDVSHQDPLAQMKHHENHNQLARHHADDLEKRFIRYGKKVHHSISSNIGVSSPLSHYGNDSPLSSNSRSKHIVGDVSSPQPTPIATQDFDHSLPLSKLSLPPKPLTSIERLRQERMAREKYERIRSNQLLMSHAQTDRVMTKKPSLVHHPIPLSTHLSPSPTISHLNPRYNK